MKQHKKAIKIAGIVLGVIVIVCGAFVCLCTKTTTENVKLTYDTSQSVSTDYSSDNDRVISSLFTFDSSSTMDGIGTMLPEETTTGSSGSTGADLDTDSSLTEDKLLRKTYDWEVESTDYDNFLSSIEQKVDSLDGYIENRSSVSRDYTNSLGTETRTVRRTDYQIRVPVNNMEALLNDIGDGAYVTCSNEYVEDVTSQYADLEAHIASLKDEYDRLDGLLTSATSVSETIEIQDRLSAINYELAVYEKSMDRLSTDIEYSKLYLTVNEVIYYSDTVKKFSSDLAEDWYYVFIDWLSEVFPMVLLVSISFIPLLALIGFTVWILSGVTAKRKAKYSQTIVIQKPEEE
jgi:hypothetical protein